VASVNPGSKNESPEFSITQLPSRRTASTPNNPTGLNEEREKSNKYVILGVAAGENLHLAQIAVQSYRDDQFFQQLLSTAESKIQRTSRHFAALAQYLGVFSL